MFSESAGGTSSHRPHHFVGEPRPSLRRPRTERKIGETRKGKPCVRIDPEEGAAAPEVSERAGRVARACPVRHLGVADLEAETPVVRILATEARQDADKARELRRRRLVERLSRDAGGDEQLARHRAEAADGARRPPGRRAVEGDPAAGPDGVEVVGERHLGALGNQLGSNLEPVVRVDAAPPGRRDRRACIERQPRGVGEQVAKGGPGRACRLVEIDEALFGGDQNGDSGRELRHGGKGEHPVGVAVDALDATRDCDGGMAARPGVDLPQGLHRRQAIGVERQRISSGSPFEARFGYSRAVRVGDRILVAGTAPIMPDNADPPTGAYEQAQVCLGIIGRALTEAGASLDDVVRSRVYVTDPAHIDDVGRAHAEAFSEARPVLTGVVTGLLDPRWLVEIEVEAVILQP